MQKNKKPNQDPTLSQGSDIEIVLKWIRDGLTILAVAGLLGWMAISIVGLTKQMAVVETKLDILIDNDKKK